MDVEKEKSELTFEDRLILLDEFRKILISLHHASGEEMKVKLQIFIAILKKFSEKHPEKKEALVEIFGDFEKGNLSKFGNAIYEDLKNIGNYSDRGPFFKEYWMKKDKVEQWKFERKLFNSLRDREKFMKFIHENRKLLGGLKDFI